MLRTQIQLTEDQARALKELADRNDVSMAEMIRRSVDELLARQHSVSPKDLKMRPLAVAGRYHSGQTDLAREHDRYLAEAFDR